MLARAKGTYHKNINLLLLGLFSLSVSLIKSRPKFIVIVGTVLYISLWTYISLSRYISLNAYIYDLGVSSIKLWLVYHTNWTLHTFFLQLFYQGDQFVLFPLVIPGNNMLLLVFQTILLGVPAIFIYLISCEKLHDEVVSAVVALSYLIFFPLAGINWFDFHFQAFFIAFFIIGYYFSLKQKYVLALLLFFLSGMVRFPYAIFPFLLSFYEVMIFLYLRIRGIRKEYSANAVLFYISLLILSTFLLIGGLVTIYASSISNAIISNPNNISITADLHLKFLTIAIFLGPFLFIPLLSRRFALLALPFFILVFFFNKFGYYAFPYVIILQYSSGIIPFIYLGFIEGLKNLDFSDTKLAKSGKKPIFWRTFYKRYSVRKLQRKIAYLSVFIIVVLALFYEPYGPLNHYTGVDDYNYEITKPLNLTQYEELTTIITMIPQNTSILVQDNLPQILPGQIANNLYVPGEIKNFSLGNIMNNSFPLSVNNIEQNVSIDYLLADLNNIQMFQYSVNPYNPTFATIINRLLETKLYGIMIESNGFLLIKRGYRSNPINFSPAAYPKLPFVESGKINYAGGSFYVWNILGVLPPKGNYYSNISYSVISNPANVNNNVSLNFFLINGNSDVILGYKNLSMATTYGFVSGSYTIHFSLNNGVTNYLRLGAEVSFRINSSLNLESVSIYQVSF